MGDLGDGGEGMEAGSGSSTAVGGAAYARQEEVVGHLWWVVRTAEREAREAQAVLDAMGGQGPRGKNGKRRRARGRTSALWQQFCKERVVARQVATREAADRADAEDELFFGAADDGGVFGCGGGSRGAPGDLCVCSECGYRFVGGRGVNYCALSVELPWISSFVEWPEVGV